MATDILDDRHPAARQSDLSADDLTPSDDAAHIIPIKADRRSKRARANTEQFNDDEAAKRVVAVSRSKRPLHDSDIKRLMPPWTEAYGLTLESGPQGIGQFLTWIIHRPELEPERIKAIRQAIEKAEDSQHDEDLTVDDHHGNDRNDQGNARRLVQQFGDRIRFHTTWKVWLIWDGRRWKEDTTFKIVRMAKKTVQAIYGEAANARDESSREAIAKWAHTSGNRTRIDSMIQLAQSEPGIPVEPSELDSDLWLFNTKNGTIDLRTGELRPHRKEDKITKLSPVRYEPHAPAPLWDGFLEKFLGAETGMIDFLRRASGYALTGDTSEQCLFFPHGDGANGKSTFLLTLIAVFGDYARTIDPKILATKEHDEHPTELCDLDGPRLIVTVEVEDGKKMAESLVKRITGGDRIRARRMRRDPYEFEPRFKLFMAANHKPVIRGTDHGIWRRIRMLPFDYTIPESEKIKGFDKLLGAELPGVLAWCVKGCLEWQEANGLNPPDAVTSATEEYRRDQDTVQQFIDQCCHLDDNFRSESKHLYRRYKELLDEEGARFIMSHKAFAIELDKKKFEKLPPSNGKTWRTGIALAHEG